MTQASGEDLKRRFGTRAVHAGHIPDPLAGAVMTPIYQTSTYIQEGLGRHKGYEYARTRNPTREVLERNVAALEGGRHGFAFASGLAALDAALKLLSRHRREIAADECRVLVKNGWMHGTHQHRSETYPLPTPP